MSESINNREYRKNVIKQVIKELHDGKSIDEVKQKFEEAFSGVSATEISEAEQALINEGLPVSEVQRLCDVHSAVFKGSIEEIHRESDPTKIPGHPANVIILENRELEKIIEKKIKPYLDNLSDKTTIENLQNGFKELLKIDIHYSKKENLLFPYMEKYGITAPPKVMWGVDDEIRADLKSILSDLEKGETNQDTIKKIEEAITRVNEMIFKEENIMLPMLIDVMTQDEWKKVADDDEIGHMLRWVPEWKPEVEAQKEIKEEMAEPGAIILPTGVFQVNELVHMLNTLPFDITFVGSDETVKYFSQSSERIFPRTKTVIGRNVSNCHPPASVHIVEGIVEDLKSGKKDHEDFWIKMKDKYVYIRYFAVRDEKGEFLGVVEVTQDIKHIQEITGEKRLVTE